MPVTEAFISEYINTMLYSTSVNQQTFHTCYTGSHEGHECESLQTAGQNFCHSCQSTEGMQFNMSTVSHLCSTPDCSYGMV